MGRPCKRRKIEVKMRRLLSRFPESGLKVKDFCRRHRISQFRFYYWRRRLKAGVPVPAKETPPPLVRISTLDIPSGRSHYELYLPDGVRLRIPPDFDRESLGSLLSVLSC